MAVCVGACVCVYVCMREGGREPRKSQGRDGGIEGEKEKEQREFREKNFDYFTHTKPSKLTHHEASWSRPFLWEGKSITT